MNRSLRICLISYRSNPHSGGQGVYVKNLSQALVQLGHRVDVISGPPNISLNNGVHLIKIPCLDLYDPADMFRIPTLQELKNPINIVEWFCVSTMGFPEVFTFGLRAYLYLKNRLQHYDIIHDNQCLSYGIWGLSKFIPTVATIHHPITIDREIAVRAEKNVWQKIKHLRWHSFIGMQKRVAQRLSHIITVSAAARTDIQKKFNIPFKNFRVIPNGINTEQFIPGPFISKKPNRIIVTNSADTPLKGLKYLLFAISKVAKSKSIELVIVGSPKEDSNINKLISDLNIAKIITFTGRITDKEFLKQYAQAAIAVVPSVYEGFGLPVGEAMACGVPVISTTGGALPEVVGKAGLLVPPKDANALADAIIRLLDQPEYAKQLGQEGYNRVKRNFTWEQAAKKTIAVYKEAIHAYV